LLYFIGLKITMRRTTPLKRLDLDRPQEEEEEEKTK
jgi:hypothetical protein